MVPLVSENNNNYNVVSDSNSEDNNNNGNKNFFDEDNDNEVKAIPKTTINAKVVHGMKKLQALYNNDAKKFKQAAQEKCAIKNLNFLIDLAILSNNTKPSLEEPQTFNIAWNHPSKEFYKKW